MAMNKRLKKQWVKALRRTGKGSYRQGNGALCRVDDDGQCSFCCLGVLLDIGYDGEWKRVGREYQIDGRKGLPCDMQRAVLGLSAVATRALAAMNDGGSSFAEIADYIERSPDI